jgi:GH25 family lysozyme M1 (1,4-beta-N-acetylmuramidase)
MAPAKLHSSKRRVKRRWFVLSLVAVLLALGWMSRHYLTTLIPYPEWLPIREHANHTFGIDVSHYQGSVSWSMVAQSHHPIEFVFVRATMGKDGRDQQFVANWEGASEIGLLRGAYHYYRPWETSTEQFDNFRSVVQLRPGDLPPVLDVEEMGSLGRDNLRKGVANWIALCEAHYGMKPIIYTGRNFYKAHLSDIVKGCPLWIAAYSGKHRLRGIDWHFHQFTERVRVNGIRGGVDGNDFNGSIDELRAMAIRPLNP